MVWNNNEPLTPHKELCKRLGVAGVVRVHVDFDGQGDSGGIECITYYGLNDMPVDPVEQDTVENMIYDYMQQAGADFNNDGSYGTASLNVTEAKVHVELNTRIVDSEFSQETYEL